MTVLYTGIQAFCAAVTLCLTIYVVWRDTRHMNTDDKRLKTAEKLAQPSSIAAWLERDPTGDARIVIRNDSDLPVYEVVATIVVTHGAGCCKGEDLESPYQYRKILDLIPPGLHSVSIDMGGFYGMHRHPLVEIAFVCAKGKTWVRRGNGTLDELNVSPFNHYELGLPIDFDLVVPHQNS
ncbi:Uncharacterised protein [Collinsella aerofaciens]|uniref:Uncharacterized protein n=1 Tax=Collinsella aerofaciens TaxID=74426 RepID=A0A6N3C8D1_9ACTN